MYKIKIYLFAVLLIFSFAVSCSDTDAIPEEEELIVIPGPSEPEAPVTDVDQDNVVTINTGVVVGEMYNFWSTRPMINQTRFNAAGFRSSIEPLKEYVKDYNLVRLIGGRNDDQNTFFKGVDGSGKIITDFSGLISSMRNFMSTGFKPRIVLDNVPWGMSGERIEDTYGNSKPPLDYDLWRQYINALLQELVAEFGMFEVKKWRFRVATEPNYTPDHWRGTRDEYFKHYDITVDEVLKVIPDAIIGPGNLLTEGAATWKTEIIDHCANGTNYATGQQGTRMSFFCISYYEKIDRNEMKWNEVISLYRNKLDSYPQFSDIPFDIQEFGILRGDNGNRGATSLNDGSEFGASWYATIASLAYGSSVTEIYDWGQESHGLASGRRNVTEMLLKMEGGSRLQSIEPMSVDNIHSFAGVIPVSKEGKLYLLVYNHHTKRGQGTRTLFPVLEGGAISGVSQWKMNEWTIDKTHGVFMNELYDDIIESGVATKTNGRIYGTSVGDYFEDGWESVFNANKSKYEELSKLPQTKENLIIETLEGKVTLKVEMPSQSVKLIELIPQ